ncbi:hypothetical protein DSO57_1000840 [Entomophthora muscae]|uniref:Uncharacterized protein n=1 Tax=Entomophthora muscae TaxID=34485 RepID=A0ACC2U8I6_9FUNG|nr:hypothetical protein DSO57_1000840 [Entomophthora muscae]
MGIFMMELSAIEGGLIPIAAREKYVHNYHHHQFKDYYHWLRDDGEPSERVLEYLRSENNYTHKFVSKFKPLVDTIYREIEAFGHVEKNHSFRVGEYTYFCDKSNGLSNYTRAIRASKQLVQDFNRYPESTVEGEFIPSPDNSKVAYTLDLDATEEYQLFIKDIRTSEERFISKVSDPNFAWSPDSSSIFYIIRDEASDLPRLMRYRQNKAMVLFEEEDINNSIEIYLSVSQRFLFLKRGTATSSEVHSLELTNSHAKLQLISPISPNRIYSVDHQNDTFLIVTNTFQDKHYPSFALFSAPITAPSRWTPVTNYNPKHHIISMYGLENAILLEVLINGIQYIKYIKNNTIFTPSFTQHVFHARYDQLQYTSSKVQIIYSSPITPTTLYELDLNTHKTKLLHTNTIPGYSQSNYIVERISTRNKIPITLIYEKSRKHRTSPLVLEGYGGYGTNIEPKFMPQLPSLLNRGFIYAIAHVRGGTEKGEKWHEQGKLLNKMNSFKDFAECAHHLRSSSIASHITAIGSSAGGLLVAATINQNPDLFQTAILNGNLHSCFN